MGSGTRSRALGGGQPVPPVTDLVTRRLDSRSDDDDSSADSAGHAPPPLSAELAEQHPSFLATSFTPHDFRRLLATYLVNNGLPLHIGAALLGHLNLQTTRGYVAVFNEDVVHHYQEFLDRRRKVRSVDEYKPVTNSEWSEFEEHFDRRKVELGGCTRPCGSACQHEHSCLRCPMLAINPKMLPRLDEIEDDLLTRRARAEHEAWLGEVEGIDLTLTGDAPHLLATAIEEGRDLSSMSGILADSSYRLLPA
jgi:hypothetical protein